MVVVASEITKTRANTYVQDLKAPKVSATALNRTKNKSRLFAGKPESPLTRGMCDCHGNDSIGFREHAQGLG